MINLWVKHLKELPMYIFRAIIADLHAMSSDTYYSEFKQIYIERKELVTSPNNGTFIHTHVLCSYKYLKAEEIPPFLRSGTFFACLHI